MNPQNNLASFGFNCSFKQLKSHQNVDLKFLTFNFISDIKDSLFRTLEPKL